MSLHEHFFIRNAVQVVFIDLFSKNTVRANNDNSLPIVFYKKIKLISCRVRLLLKFVYGTS